jgi:hypothetical protein
MRTTIRGDAFAHVDHPSCISHDGTAITPAHLLAVRDAHAGAAVLSHRLRDSGVNLLQMRRVAVAVVHRNAVLVVLHGRPRNALREIPIPSRTTSTRTLTARPSATDASCGMYELAAACELCCRIARVHLWGGSQIDSVAYGGSTSADGWSGGYYRAKARVG